MKEAFDRPDIVLSREVRSQQEIKKQTEEKDLANNPNNLNPSMHRGATVRQSNISPGS
jgi:hypothetical protein